MEIGNEAALPLVGHLLRTADAASPQESRILRCAQDDNS